MGFLGILSFLGFLGFLDGFSRFLVLARGTVQSCATLCCGTGSNTCCNRTSHFRVY